jgi:pyruvate kinase
MAGPLIQPPPLQRRRTKIVATVGPASREPATLEALIQAGVNVFRLNLAHGEHIEHRTTYERIRAAAERSGLPVAILADLCGPKMRVGKIKDGPVSLQVGDVVTVTTRNVEGGRDLIPVSYEGLPNDVRANDRILINDGLVELRVQDIQGSNIRCEVQSAGLVGDRKGVNLPGVPLSFATLTDQDRIDAHFALDLGVDFLALSFVRRAEDVADLKKLISGAGHLTPVIAKIERPEALTVIDEVLECADGLMVARGDLGVELPPEAVPIVQQGLMQRARYQGKPIIVATQMLESMVQHPRPTRAEVSDVSHAVFGGADAVMLSAETAAGAYPLRAVQMMDRVARQVEGWQWVNGAFASLDNAPPVPVDGTGQQAVSMPLRQGVARSTAQLARELRVKAVVVRSRGGRSARVVAATRPAAPVLALTQDPSVVRQLNLLWGVIPQEVTPAEFDDPKETARRLTQDMGLAGPDDVILLLAGFGKSEPTLTILSVGGPIPGA